LYISAAVQLGDPGHIVQRYALDVGLRDEFERREHDPTADTVTS
jgi:hypothetical protein